VEAYWPFLRRRISAAELRQAGAVEANDDPAALLDALDESAIAALRSG
jgi:hypothetical protein